MDEFEPKESEPMAWAASDQLVDIYSNILHLDWTLHDLTVRFGQLKYAGDPRLRKLTVKEQACVTMAWGEAKYFRNMLNDLIAKYESVNGEIQHPKLAPSE